MFDTTVKILTAALESSRTFAVRSETSGCSSLGNDCDLSYKKWKSCASVIWLKWVSLWGKPDGNPQKSVANQRWRDTVRAACSQTFSSEKNQKKAVLSYAIKPQLFAPITTVSSAAGVVSDQCGICVLVWNALFVCWGSICRNDESTLSLVFF